MAPGTADKSLVEPICERGHAADGNASYRRIEGGGWRNGNLGVDYFF
jgi:hypothetical protein